MQRIKLKITYQISLKENFNKHGTFECDGLTSNKAKNHKLRFHEELLFSLGKRLNHTVSNCVVSCLYQKVGMIKLSI